ncbi:hypothetical protein Bhyg_13401 [Pseudolycoriella hygida]|uniref:Uncharacterized protein n=1 Tax=Pseudolycoriella hygida TaxID=35572 RepID=A0A9Q0MN81_9DIPT|nr:hypothetical protein Bhyg_13401 [Pseudolycoriella hygida]
MTPISSTTGIARDLNPVASTASTSVSIMQNVSPVLIASEDHRVPVKTFGTDALNTVLTSVKKTIIINKLDFFFPKAVQTELSFQDIDQIFKS